MSRSSVKKKSLSRINILFMLLFFIAGCNQTQSGNEQTDTLSAATVADTATSVPDTSAATHSEPVETAPEKIDSVKKDSQVVKKKVEVKAVEHRSPDQSRIDSIKEAKTKKKLGN